MEATILYSHVGVKRSWAFTVNCSGMNDYYEYKEIRFLTGALRGRGEDCEEPDGHPCWDAVDVDPKGHPGQDDDQRARHKDLDHEVSEASTQPELDLLAGIGTWGRTDRRTDRQTGRQTGRQAGRQQL